MSKELIGNSLSFCMQDILKGKISIDDIDTIYAGTCFTEDTIPDLLDGYEFYWESAARDIAGEEIAKQYGVESIWEISDKVKSEKAMQQKEEKLAEIMPKVKSEARQIFYSLYEKGKIVQTRYRIPKGEKEIATYVNLKGEITNNEHEVSSADEGLMKINGKLYQTIEGRNCVYTDSQHLWCNNKKEFIASQLSVTSSSNSHVEYTKAGMLKILFPEYEKTISKLCENMSKNYLNSEDSKWPLNFEEILGKLEELTQNREEHTSAEIGDGVKESVRMETMQEVLAHITEKNIDKQQEEHSIND